MLVMGIGIGNAYCTFSLNVRYEYIIFIFSVVIAKWGSYFWGADDEGIKMIGWKLQNFNLGSEGLISSH